jgi:alkanesulfonate monooxygenase SsuD/methylene tetrahydromethanopterin reductase-like flavin-dependent oxidoreductase (luciferase family)
VELSMGLPTTVPGRRGPDLAEVARRAEESGFSGLGVLDRLVYDSEDPLLALAVAAAVTSRIRLTTTVLLAACRGAPAVLAKQLASLHQLSGRRLVVGVAAGGRPDDFAVAGQCYTDRGRRLDAALDTFREVWTGSEAGPVMGPIPPGGGISLLVGGHSEAAMARAARYAGGWIAGGSSASSFPELLARVRQAWAAHGRTDLPRTVALSYVSMGRGGQQRADRYFRDYYSYIGPKAEQLARGVITGPEALRSTVDGYAAAGCDELVLMPCTADPGHVDLVAGALP